MDNVMKDEKASVAGVVLLVEDDDIVMEVSRSMMEKMGYTVLEAETGQKAVETMGHPDFRIDLVLMDMDMPDMKGPEIFDGLRAVRPDVKVVVCSGQAEDSTVETLIGLGVHGFLQKPYSYKNLEEVLIKHVERRHEPRVRALDNFLSVSGDNDVRNIRILDISRGGFSFVCGKGVDDKDALIDVAVIMAGRGVNIDELECRIVSDKTLDPNDPETGAAMKRIGVSFGKMTRQQFENLSALISACSGKE